MQQPIDSAKIDKCAIVGEILDHALELRSFLQVLEQLLAFGAVFLLDYRTSGNHHVVALLVKFGDFEFERAPLQKCRVANRPHIHERPRQEGPDQVEIDSKPAANAAADGSLDNLAVVERFLQAGPGTGALGFLPGQAGFAKTILNRIQRDLDLIAYCHFQFAPLIEELVGWNNSFRFQTGVDDDHVRVYVHHRRLQDGTVLHVPTSETFLQQFGKRFSHACFPLPRTSNSAPALPGPAVS